MKDLHSLVGRTLSLVVILAFAGQRAQAQDTKKPASLPSTDTREKTDSEPAVFPQNELRKSAVDTRKKFVCPESVTIDCDKMSHLKDALTQVRKRPAYAKIARLRLLRKDMKTIHSNNRILFRRILKEHAPGDNPVVRPKIANVLKGNLKSLEKIIDNVSNLPLSDDEKDTVLTFIKANLASCSELLLARSKDQEESTEVSNATGRLTSKIQYLFKVSMSKDSGEQSPKSANGRVGSKANISSFTAVVDKL